METDGTTGRVTALLSTRSLVTREPELLRKEKAMGYNNSTCQCSSSDSKTSFWCVLSYVAAFGLGLADELCKSSPNPERRLKAPVFREFSKLAENVAKIVC